MLFDFMPCLFLWFWVGSGQEQNGIRNSINFSHQFRGSRYLTAATFMSLHSMVLYRMRLYRHMVLLEAIYLHSCAI